MKFRLFNKLISIETLDPHRYRVTTEVRDHTTGPVSRWFVSAEDACRFATNLTVDDYAFIERFHDFYSVTEVWDTWKNKRLLRQEVNMQEEVVKQFVNVVITK